ncbi:unnamed protein product [Sphagnum balticum]
MIQGKEGRDVLPLMPQSCTYHHKRRRLHLCSNDRKSADRDSSGGETATSRTPHNRPAPSSSSHCMTRPASASSSAAAAAFRQALLGLGLQSVKHN